MASVERCTVLITLVLVVHCGEHIVNGVISDIRLVDGPTSNKGTVEIRQDNGSWETTCGVNLGINDVIVICKQLGFKGASRAITNTTYGQSSTPTRGLTCSGDEDNLAECTLFSNAACSIAGAASCHGDGYIGCFKDDVRDRVLPGIQIAYSLMTISYSIQYCNESNTANYTYAGLENGYAGYCHSSETSDNFARHGVVSDANCQIPCFGDPTDSCGGSLYIAVYRLFQSTPPSTTVAETSPTIATTDTTTTTTTSTPSSFASTSGQLDVNTDVRLVDGPTSNKGTVEIRQDNGSWETTCGVNLGIHDVIVICRHLGFTGASRAITNTTYGQSSTPTRGLTCSGDEDNLAECTLFSNAACSIAGAASCHGDGYIGCFKDDERDRVLPGLQLASSLMSISFCIKYCNESTRANYTYAGLEHGYACYCHSGEASDDFARHGEVSDANCQIPCLGDPTDSCVFQSTPPSTTVAETSPAIATTDTTTSTPSSFASTSGQLDVNTVSQSTHPPTTVADTSTFASTSGQVDLKTVFQSTPPPTTSADTSSTFASTSGQVDLKTEIASTLAVGILLAFVTLYGIIITLMYLHLRRSKIALKPSVSDREGQELDPYTSLDTTTMKQPAYEDIKATRQGNRGYINAIEGVEYGNQRIVEQTARVKKSNLGVADENTEPEYELPM
ncbi:location of vulva defective 1 isoform X2 [Strongylocentrotus purpuratus]|uniref:Uncharacterized protein n=1 Tax=Strongylocentrotus purpuratus TaxID=7668 RepID=A0A7M7NN81_STRPU|nr:location of vulva defective 1 isoform X2 [Strongylocentrotus purpuratus]